MKRAFFVPEVIQTSSMDCGPACLAALLRGLGVPASYARLREACRVGLDGTAVSTLEEVLVGMGVDAAEVMVPIDHVLRPEARNLPAIAVVGLPDGAAHFVVLWRRVGRWVQVMDPASGRSWVRDDELLDQLLRHTVVVPTEDWEAWAATEDFQAPLRAALAEIGAPPSDDPLPTVEAAAAATCKVLRAGVIRRAHAPAVFAQLRDADLPRITRPATAGLACTGAVLVRVRGHEAVADAPYLEPRTDRPWRPMLDLIREDLHPASLLAGTLAVAALGVVEALVIRAIVPLVATLPRLGDRLVLAACVVGIVALGLAVDRRRLATLLALGRALDTRFRVALFEKLPRIADPWFASRPASDMADRAASTRMLQVLPRLVGELALQAASLVATALALCVLDPCTAPLTLLVAAGSVAAPALVMPLLREREARARAHNGALVRFHLDAQVGLLPARAQGGEATLTAAHEGLLAEWARAAGELGRAGVVVEAIVGMAGALGAIGLVAAAALRTAEPPTLLLQLWWALSLPAIGEALVALARQLPAAEAVAGRLVEPLSTPEEPDVAAASADLDLRGVTVHAGGHTILDAVDLHVAAGEHVAVVGPSGAGKSALIGVLLGLHAPTAGTAPNVRRRAAWVDPAAQLWDRSLLENLRFARAEGEPDWSAVLQDAELLDVVGALDDGLAERLGAGGARLSGGQGQRVRLGRALARETPDVVLLDEPFRGLDRATRSRLLRRVRERHAAATLLCVTHDVRDTLTFPRVLVIDGGRIVEDGVPATLAGQDSRYAAMIAAAERVDVEVWGEGWQRIDVADGAVHGA